MSGRHTPVDAASDADADADPPPRLRLARQQQAAPFSLQVSPLHVNTDSRNNSMKKCISKTKKRFNCKRGYFFVTFHLSGWK